MTSMTYIKKVLFKYKLYKSAQCDNIMMCCD